MMDKNFDHQPTTHYEATITQSETAQQQTDKILKTLDYYKQNITPEEASEGEFFDHSIDIAVRPENSQELQETFSVDHSIPEFINVYDPEKTPAIFLYPTNDPCLKFIEVRYPTGAVEERFGISHKYSH